MMKCKFLFVSTQLEAGGAQVKGVNLAAELRRRGHDAHVWFLYRKRCAFGADEQNRCLLPRQPRSPADVVSILARLSRLIREQRPDVVVGLAHYASPLSCGFARLHGVPARMATQCDRFETFPRLAAWLDWLAGIAGAYTSNIAASDAVRESFARFPKAYRCRLSVIYDGIQLRSSALDQRAARDLFSLPQEVPLLVNVGRLAVQKNQMHLIRVLQGLPRTHLAILGEGELRSELQTAIASMDLAGRVHLLGEIDPARVPDFLRCGDLFVFPSLHEGFGLAAVEAMQLGLPVVSSNVSPLSDLIGAAGILLPVSDVATWTNSIFELLADSDRRRELGQRAQARAACFSVELMADRYEALGRVLGR